MKRIGIFGKTNKGSSEENNNNNDPGGGDEEDEDAAAAGDSVVNVFKKKNNPLRTTQREVQQQQQSQQQQQHSASATVARPNYRSTTAAEHDEEEEDNSSHHQHHQNNNNNNQDDDEYNNHDNNNNTNNNAHHNVPAENIEKSAGSTRLNRILRTTQETSSHAAAAAASTVGGSTILNSSSGKSSRNLGSGGDTAATASSSNNNTTGDHQRVSNPRNWREIAHFCSRHVVPPLKVDSSSIGGSMLDSYPESMQQECLLASLCESFESSTTTMTSTTTTSESVVLSALQYPHEYNKHKRMLGSLGGGMAATKGGGGAAHHHHHQRANASKIRYVILARSTNRPMLSSSQKRQYEMMRLKQQQQQSAVLQQQQQSAVQGEDEVQPNQQQQRLDKDLSDRGDYDAMFSPEDSEYDDDNEEDDDENGRMKRTMDDKNVKNTTSMTTPAALLSDGGSLNQKSSLGGGDLPPLLMDDEEVSSFPVLICMTLQSDGTGPDIRKLIPLDQLTTVQDLHSTVVQLAFSNGDTIRLDFGSSDGVNDTHKNTSSVLVERPLDKERFLWSLLQIHAMLCMAVVERNSRGAATFLPPLNVRNLDRAELQYVATINGFLKQNEILKILLERQQKAAIEHEAAIAAAAVSAGEEKQRDEIMDIDTLAYNLMMGNFATRVVLFHSEDERKDAEEILNSADWTDMLNSKEETAAVSVAERLGFMLQSRMRDLEAETCRRLIAWEDEKHLSLGGRAKLHDVSDARDTVDALALASLFKTLESLDAELKAMEDWLQDRAGAIKPLTDDCADIEEENRQLEQQWKSYDMLGAEMRRLLHGQEIDETTKGILRNPASVLLYDETGQVNVEESELGIERIYEAGKALLEALEFPKKSGGFHLKAVSERANSLTSLSTTFCSSLAQIIVTVMEQFKTVVVAGSDGGKVSKNDTHTMISTKIRDTQRKFQSSLLSYIKLIEVLAALSPEMLPALRDAYAEMVSEGILMKKRMKGYFQALPGKNAAFLNKTGKDLKDYIPFSETFMEDTVNAPDIRAVLNELLPVIAREAYFTSALFGSTTRDQDGREKKRNFENAKSAVDKASTHFRYYMNRTCGIYDASTAEAGDASHKGDPMLCFVATIYLNEAMDNFVDREKKGGDHSLSLAYVRATILDLRKKADKQWVSWVEKQIEWIKSSEGVPSNGKRAGIFPSFSRFPIYLDHGVQCCKEGRDLDYFPDLPGIKIINYYLQKLALTLLDSLKECARRETTDQSYASNVMEMENTYFFTQAIKERGDVMEKLFAKQVTKANAICKESTDAYLGWMIKREFTALHELFSRVSKIRKEQGDNDVIVQVPKVQFIKIMQKEANRDIMKEKIGAMYSRMEKHLCDEGDLLSVAWKALVKVLYEWFGRWEKLCSSIYRHKLDPSPVDVVRIAKAAGGAAKPILPATQGTEFGFKSILALGNKQSSQ